MTNKYENGKIYKLVNKVTNEVYFGSTVNSLNKRLGQHKAIYKKYKKDENIRPVTSVKLFETNIDDVEIVLIEEYPAENKRQLLLREQYYIKNNICVNRYLPGRTQKEYYQDNAESIKLLIKNYRIKHEKKIKQKKKEYYHKNILIISEKKSKIIKCECGLESTRNHMARHRKSNRHNERMEKL